MAKSLKGKTSGLSLALSGGSAKDRRKDRRLGMFADNALAARSAVATGVRQSAVGNAPRALEGPRNHFLLTLATIAQKLWSWGAIWAIVGTLIFGVWQVLIGGNEFFEANCVFALGVLILGAKTLHWTNALEQQRQGRVWASIVVCVLLASALLGEWFWVARKATKSEYLHANITGEMISSARDEGIFIAEYYEIRGKVITTVNIAMSLVITNRSKDPIWLGHAEIDYKTGWGIWPSWKPLYVIPAIRIFNLQKNDFEHVIPISFNASSINQLSQQALEPEKAYPAYALLQYSRQDKIVTPLVLRVKICDLDDNCSINEIGKISNSGAMTEAAFGSGMTMSVIGAPLDVRASQFGYMDDRR